MTENGENCDEIVENLVATTTKIKKPPKRGIIYLATIPPYMNVTQIKEYFSQFGKVDRVYLQKPETLDWRTPLNKKKKTKKKGQVKYIEGWVEFERKSVAKKVALLLNNKQVDTRKKSKHYDSIWNLKYLPSFKWVHLNERLIYEKIARRQKLRKELEKAKRGSAKFTGMIGKRKTSETNREFENLNEEMKTVDKDMDENVENKRELIESLW